MTFNGPWGWGNLRKSGIDFGVAPYPRIGSHAGGSFVGVLGAMISSASRQRELAHEFIEDYLLSLPSLRAIDADVPLGVPANKALYAERSADPLIAGSMAAVRAGSLMPSNPEMTRFWTAMQAALQNITQGREQVARRPRVSSNSVPRPAIAQHRAGPPVKTRLVALHLQGRRWASSSLSSLALAFALHAAHASGCGRCAVIALAGRWRVRGSTSAPRFMRLALHACRRAGRRRPIHRVPDGLHAGHQLHQLQLGDHLLSFERAHRRAAGARSRATAAAWASRCERRMQRTAPPALRRRRRPGIR